MLRFATLALVVAMASELAACGGVNVSTPKAAATPEPQAAPADTVGEAGDKPTATAVPSHVTGAKVTVDVKVEVDADAAAAAGAPLYVPVARSWQAAQDMAPAGYRLATRSEALALVDAGALADVAPANPTVWTATPHGDTQAWLLELSTGVMAPAPTTTKIPCIYVQKGDAQ